MIHWVIERDADGMPSRMLWSSADQRAGDQKMAQDAERIKTERARHALPMPAMREWLRKANASAR